MLSILTAIRQCLLRLMIVNCKKSILKISEKVSLLMNIKFDSEHVYSDNVKYIKTKIKQIQIFKTKNTKRKCIIKFFSLIILDSIIRVNKKYYHQTLLEECKYETKKTKIENLKDYLDLSSLAMNLIMRLNLVMMNNLQIFKTLF